MRNLFEENPKVAWNLMIVAAVLGLGVHLLVKSSQERTQEMIEKVENDGEPKRIETDRLAEIRKAEYKEPERALTLVEDILKAPASVDETAQAKEKHANILKLLFHKRLKANDLDEAHKLLDRLVQTYPDSFQIKGVHQGWSQKQKEICRSHLKTNALAQAKIIITDLSDNNWLFDDVRLLDDFQKQSIEAWLREETAGGDNAKNLLTAVSVIGSVGMNSPISAAISRSPLLGSRTLQLADWLSDQTPGFGGIPFYQATLQKLNRSGDQWDPANTKLNYQQREQLRTRINGKLAGVFLRLSAALEIGAKPFPMTLTAESVCQQAVGQIQPMPLRVPLYRQWIKLQKQELDTLAKPALAWSLDKLAAVERPKGDDYNNLNQALRKSGSLADDILRRSGAGLWASLVSDTNFNPWPLISADTNKEFDERRAKGAREVSLRQSLGSKGNSREFRIPLSEFDDVRRLLGEINIRRGLLIYHVQPQECAMWTRRALADNRDPKFETAIHNAIVKAILSSRGSDKFENFYELTSFFVGDIGLDKLPAELRRSFKEAISETANAMAVKSRPKAIFLWTVEAEAIGNQSAGQKARDTAIAAAFEEVSGSPVNTVGPERLVPAGLSNLSVLSIDNSTEHHLLIFYKGPETFAVPCRPYRKVSAVMKNGAYDIAVITPSGAIQPYKGKVTLNNHWQKSNYRIESSANQRKEMPPGFASSASGKYQVARFPQGTGPFSINEKNGEITVAR